VNGNAFLLKSDICDSLMTNNAFPVTYSDLLDPTISVVFPG